jgi:hypothetical protein
VLAAIVATTLSGQGREEVARSLCYRVCTKPGLHSRSNCNAKQHMLLPSWRATCEGAANTQYGNALTRCQYQWPVPQTGGQHCAHATVCQHTSMNGVSGVFMGGYTVHRLERVYTRLMV